MSLNTIIEEEMKKFDETFGTAGPEKEFDSKGRNAGCDDCDGNVKLREEHKSHLTSALTRAYNQGRGEVLAKIIIKSLKGR